MTLVQGIVTGVLKGLNDRIDGLETNIINLGSKNEELEKENTSLLSRVAALEKTADQFEQYSRRNSLRVRVRPGATGQKAQKVQANQCLDQYELLVLNLPVRPVQLEHNVHESLGNMPSVQNEHSSEDSQAFQSLLISDSLDDNAHEYPDGLLCVILNIGLRASVTLITGQTMSIQSTDHVRLGLMLLTTGQFC